MTKRKKTRQQKIIADLRRNLQSKNQHSFESLQNQHSPVIPQPIIEETYKVIPQVRTATKPLTTGGYVLVASDLIKTVYLTTTIIFAELVLFFLLKNHILRVPFAKF